jgi:hypothetical protein
LKNNQDYATNKLLADMDEIKSNSNILQRNQSSTVRNIQNIVGRPKSSVNYNTQQVED